MSKIKHKEKNIKWRNADFYFVYTLAFAGIALFLYRIFSINGKSLVWSHDGIPQHLNALAYYGRYLRHILHTLLVEHKLSIPMWDLSIGYGSDIITTLHYYVIGDPLALLSVFFRSAQTELLYKILIFLRIYLAGIAFSRYSFYHKNSKQAVFMGTLIYIFAAWTIYGAIKHPYFANPLIYFPFILMGIDKIYKKEKPYIFIWSVAIAGLSNFYFFYMIGVLMVIYAIFRYFDQFADHSLKNIGKWIGIFAIYSVIAVLIAAVILLPVILPVLGTDRFNVENYVPLFYDKIYYEKYLGCLIGEDMIQWGAAGFSAVSMAGVFVMFAKKKKYTVLKAGFILLNLFLLIPYAGHVLNGFSYVCNRWIWAYAMLIAYIFLKIYPELFLLTQKEKQKIFVMMLVYCGVAILPEAARTQRNLTAVILLALSTAVIVSYGNLLVKKRSLTLLTAVLLVAGILFNMYYQYSYEKDYLADFSDQDEAMTALQTGADLAIVGSGDTNIYRYDQIGTEHMENSSMEMGTHSTSYYFSVADSGISKFMDNIYLNTPWEQQYNDLDARTILDRLASVKYFVVTDGQEDRLPYGYNKFMAAAEKDNIMYKAYTCENVLPLGYTYDRYIPEEKYEKMSAVQKQQALLQGVVLSDSSLAEKEAEFNDKDIPYSVTASEGCREEDGKFIVTKENARIELEINGLDDSETYLQVENLKYDAFSPRQCVSDEEWEQMSTYEQKKLLHQDSKWRYWENSRKAFINVRGEGSAYKMLRIFTDKYNAYSGKHNFICNTGYSQKGRKSVTLVFRNTGEYTFDSLKVICQPMKDIEAQTKQLGEEALTDISLSDNEVTGRISVSKAKALVMAIPYSKGWTAYVDGKKTEIKRANDMYMALEIPKGEHEIRFTYCTPYLYMGLGLTCMGLLCYICLVLIYKKKRGNKKE